MKKKGMLLLGLVVVLLFTSCGSKEKPAGSVVSEESQNENSMLVSAEKEMKVPEDSESEESVNNEINDEEQQIYAEEENNETEQKEDAVESDASESETEEKEIQEETDVSLGVVDPGLKAFLDEYETFMDEYVEFMKKYKDSGNSAEMLSDYLKMMERYASFAEAAEKYDSDEMSAADAAYYIEVTSRISKKMLEVAY